jgi:P pilus assembly chaperone PapD
MGNPVRKRYATRLWLLAALSWIVPAAWALSVQPVIVDLNTSGRGANQVVTVENNSPVPLPVELELEELSVGASGIEGTSRDPGDIVVFPPQALIPPGQTQTFRIQYVGDPELLRSRHFYIRVSQLPVKSAQGAPGIQVLYNVNVLASVGPQGVKPALRVRSAELAVDDDGRKSPVIVMANDSETYGYLARGSLRVVQKDGAGREVFRRTLSGPELQQMLGMGLIASGQERRFMLPISLPLETGAVAAIYTPGR